MTLVTVVPDGLTVAYGQTTVVEVSTIVVTPPKVWVPLGTAVVVAPHTVVSEVTVRVVAGIVKTPVDEKLVTPGVGRGTAEVAGAGGAGALVGALGAGGAGALEGASGTGVALLTGAALELWAGPGVTTTVTVV